MPSGAIPLSKRASWQGGWADMTKEVAGQPLWLWAAAAGVVVLGYLYFRSHSSSSSSTPSTGTGQGGTGKDTSQSSFKETIKNWQSSPTTHKHKKA